MFSKFKKVLVSLALAASLALAPMNVSATDPKKIDQDTGASDKITPVYLTGSASWVPQYTIEVSPNITINLDDKTTSAYDLNDSNEGHDGVYVKLTKADDFGDQSLQITPSFATLAGDPEITMYSVENIETTEKKKLSELGVTDNLLSFDGNVVTFAETETDTPRSVAANVDATTSAAIRKNIPDEIDGKGNIRIKDGQTIGNVTFTCGFVATP